MFSLRNEQEKFLFYLLSFGNMGRSSKKLYARRRLNTIGKIRNLIETAYWMKDQMKPTYKLIETQELSEFEVDLIKILQLR